MRGVMAAAHDQASEDDSSGGLVVSVRRRSVVVLQRGVAQVPQVAGERLRVQGLQVRDQPAACVLDDVMQSGSGHLGGSDDAPQTRRGSHP